MKSVALTRKNSLFVGNERGGQTFAVLASLVNTALCRARHKQVMISVAMKAARSASRSEPTKNHQAKLDRILAEMEEQEEKEREARRR
jgi:hypothetical protein